MGHFQHLHDPVQHAMHDLKTGGLVAPQRCRMPYILGLSLSSWIFQDNIRCLKDAYWERMRTILSDSLKESREKGRPHNLEFQRLGVGDLNRRCSIIFAVEPFEILLMRALQNGESKLQMTYCSTHEDKW